MGLMENLKERFVEEDDVEDEAARRKVRELKRKLEEKSDNLEEIELVAQNIENQLTETREKLEEVKQKKENEKEKHYWNHKLEPAIAYRIKGEKHIPLTEFVSGTNPEMRSHVIANELMIDDYPSINMLVPALVNWFKEGYLVYPMEDKGEWTSPSCLLGEETSFLPNACNLLASYLIAAGVPSWRIKNVLGRNAQGISINTYVLDDSLKRWRSLQMQSKDVLPSSLEALPSREEGESGFNIFPDETCLEWNDRKIWSEMTPKMIKIYNKNLEKKFDLDTGDMNGIY